MEAYSKKLLKFLILPLFLLSAAVFAAKSQSRADFLLHLNFYDVDSGDATFIQTHEGNKILINGGSNDKILSKLGDDLPFYDHAIDLLIVTYPTTNELGGLVSVLKRYKVKKVILPASSASSAAFQELLQLVKAKQIEKVFAKAGQRIWLDNSTVFDIYYPSETDSGGVVGKLSFGKISVLFMDQADSSLQYSLPRQFEVKSQILKLDAYATKTALTDDFVKAVSPDYIIKSSNEEKNDSKFVSDGTNLYKK